MKGGEDKTREKSGAEQRATFFHQLKRGRNTSNATGREEGTLNMSGKGAPFTSKGVSQDDRREGFPRQGRHSEKGGEPMNDAEKFVKGRKFGQERNRNTPDAEDELQPTKK